MNNNISNADLKLLKEKYQGENLDIALNKIKNGYPVQYLIGHVNFCGNYIKVDQNVLIPRFETEFLIELIKKTIPEDTNSKILDIGTGSGCIAISLSKIFKNAKIEAIDVSGEAIKIAKTNAKTNKVNNIDFKKEDLFSIDNFDGYNIIVSNPPYVSYKENVGVETKYEPQNAIFAENNGLIFYEEIIKKASKSLKVNDMFFEIGMNQYNDIKDFAKKYLNNYRITVHKDLANKDRYVHIILNK